MIIRAQNDETVEALIWRALGRLDAELLPAVPDAARNTRLEATLLIESGREVWVPNVPAEPKVPVLERSAEIWT